MDLEAASLADLLAAAHEMRPTIVLLRLQRAGSPVTPVFVELLRRNLQAVREARAKTLVTSCPACFRHDARMCGHCSVVQYGTLFDAGLPMEAMSTATTRPWPNG